MKAELCAKCEKPIGAMRVSVRVTIDELDGDGDQSGETLKKRTDYDSYECAVLGMGGVNRKQFEVLARELDTAAAEDPIEGIGLTLAAGRIRELTTGGPVDPAPAEVYDNPEEPL